MREQQQSHTGIAQKEAIRRIARGCDFQGRKASFGQEGGCAHITLVGADIHSNAISIAHTNSHHVTASLTYPHTPLADHATEEDARTAVSSARLVGQIPPTRSSSQASRRTLTNERLR